MLRDSAQEEKKKNYPYIYRGGGLSCNASLLVASGRGYNSPHRHASGIGFRPVRNAKEETC
jgi:hypothetical protein